MCVCEFAYSVRNDCVNFGKVVLGRTFYNIYFFLHLFADPFVISDVRLFEKMLFFFASFEVDVTSFETTIAHSPRERVCVFDKMNRMSFQMKRKNIWIECVIEFREFPSRIDEKSSTTWPVYVCQERPQNGFIMQNHAPEIFISAIRLCV